MIDDYICESDDGYKFSLKAECISDALDRVESHLGRITYFHFDDKSVLHVKFDGFRSGDYRLYKIS